nr:EamA family transporter [Candidatus Sigynarchaeota archaeon]
MEHAGKKQETIAIVHLVLAAFFWAFPATLGKYVVIYVSPFFVTVFRLTFSFLVFLPFMLREKQRVSLRKIDKKTWISLVVSGGIFFGPHYVFYFLSVTFT